MYIKCRITQCISFYIVRELTPCDFSAFSMVLLHNLLLCTHFSSCIPWLSIYVDQLNSYLNKLHINFLGLSLPETPLFILA